MEGNYSISSNYNTIKSQIAEFSYDEEMIKLINKLSNIIKIFYKNAKLAINSNHDRINYNNKELISDKSNDKGEVNDNINNLIDTIDFSLNIFISEAKEIFQKLKLVRRKNTFNKKEKEKSLFHMSIHSPNSSRSHSNFASHRKSLMSKRENDDIDNSMCNFNNNCDCHFYLNQKSLELARKIIEFLKVFSPLKESIFIRRINSIENQKMLNTMKDYLYKLIVNILNSKPIELRKSKAIEIENNNVDNLNVRAKSKNSKSKSKSQNILELESQLLNKDFLIQKISIDIKNKEHNSRNRNNSASKINIQNFIVKKETKENESKIKRLVKSVDIMNKENNNREKLQLNILKLETQLKETLITIDANKAERDTILKKLYLNEREFNDKLKKIEDKKRQIEKDFEKIKSQYDKDIKECLYIKEEDIKTKEKIIKELTKDNETFKYKLSELIKENTKLKMQLEEAEKYSKETNVNKIKKQNKLKDLSIKYAELKNSKEINIELNSPKENQNNNPIIPLYSPEKYSILTDKSIRKLHWFLLTSKSNDINLLQYEQCIWLPEKDLPFEISKYNSFNINNIEEEINKGKNILNPLSKSFKNNMELVSISKDLGNFRSNINNSIPIEKLEKLLNEFNNMQFNLIQSQNYIDKLKQENKELKNPNHKENEHFSFVDDEIKDIIEIPEPKSILSKDNIEFELDQRFDQLKNLLQLLIHEMNITQKTKSLLVDICSIVGYKKEEIERLLKSKNKKGKIKNFFNKIK